jgi:hypothetical protein
MPFEDTAPAGAPAASPPAGTPAPGTPAGTPPATPPGGKPADSPTPSDSSNAWRTNLPQGLREALGDTDPEEAAKIFARGKEYNPAQKTEDIALKFAEGAELHPGLEKMFKELCIAQKMTPAQAQALVEFNGKFNSEANRIYLEHGNAELEKRYGADIGKVKDNALKAFTALDRKMEGRLSASPGGKQIASDPMVVEALYLISQMISEDSLGSLAPSGGDDKAMSDKEFFERVLSEQQRGARAAL